MAFRYRVEYRAPYSNEAMARHSEVLQWLRENIGEPRITWRFSHTWYLYFRFKRDYTMFLLRWAGQK